MELFKRYVAASSMGVVALVCVLVGLLGVTVLRPPTHQVSSVTSATDLIMTRGNVLSIVKDDVTVTATSKSGAPVTLSVGTTQDVKGWIGDAAYTEVIGVESDRTKLKAESHDAIGPSRVPSPTPAQSGAQSGVQSGGQPLAEPSSADLVQQLASSDMWFKQASGDGTVSLEGRADQHACDHCVPRSLRLRADCPCAVPHALAAPASAQDSRGPHRRAP